MYRTGFVSALQQLLDDLEHRYERPEVPSSSSLLSGNGREETQRAAAQQREAGVFRVDEQVQDGRHGAGALDVGHAVLGLSQLLYEKKKRSTVRTWHVGTSERRTEAERTFSRSSMTFMRCRRSLEPSSRLMSPR